MRIHIRILVLAILVFIVNTGICYSQGVDPNVADTIYIDSVVTNSIGSSSIPVYVFNDESLAGIEITLTYNSPDVQIDSFSFTGGRIESYTLKGGDKITNNSITIYCYVLSEELIPKGNGFLGNLYFSFSSNINPQIVTIDSVTLTLGDREFSTVFSDSVANAFKPTFIKGYLNIQGGSCCLGDRGNIDNDPEDKTNINDLLYLINYMFNDGPPPACMEEGNVDGDSNGSVNINDAMYLIDYMFHDGPPPPSCP